jgi:hypothetical protein
MGSKAIVRPQQQRVVCWQATPCVALGSLSLLKRSVQRSRDMPAQWKRTGGGTLTLDPANAATLQTGASVNLTAHFADLAELVARLR